MSDDPLGTLREEQRFLLESLRDLERERDAGDVTDEDYETLREGYVARAAASRVVLSRWKKVSQPRSQTTGRTRLRCVAGPLDASRCLLQLQWSQPESAFSLRVNQVSVCRVARSQAVSTRAPQRSSRQHEH